MAEAKVNYRFYVTLFATSVVGNFLCGMNLAGFNYSWSYDRKFCFWFNSENRAKKECDPSEFDRYYWLSTATFRQYLGSYFWKIYSRLCRRTDDCCFLTLHCTNFAKLCCIFLWHKCQFRDRGRNIADFNCLVYIPT